MHPKPEKKARSRPWLFLARPIVLAIFLLSVEFWVRVWVFSVFGLELRFQRFMLHVA